MKTPIMTTSDIGNGNIIEIVMLIPKEIPIQISWLRRNCLLSILVLRLAAATATAGIGEKPMITYCQYTKNYDAFNVFLMHYLVCR